MRWFFGPFRNLIRGARILDVGCGYGAVSFYSACYGAREVVGVEPEAAGSTSGVMRRFSEFHEAGRFAQCGIVALDVMQFTDPCAFDAVVLHDSVNHIREVEADAARDSEARAVLASVVGHLAGLVRPGGWVIMSDCSRRNVFGDLGLRSPFMPKVAWAKHQNPSVWAGPAARERAGRLLPQLVCSL